MSESARTAVRHPQRPLQLELPPRRVEMRMPFGGRRGFCVSRQCVSAPDCRDRRSGGSNAEASFRSTIASRRMWSRGLRKMSRNGLKAGRKSRQSNSPELSSGQCAHDALKRVDQVTPDRWRCVPPSTSSGAGTSSRTTIRRLPRCHPRDRLPTIGYLTLSRLSSFGRRPVLRDLRVDGGDRPRR